jgi:hypothetical protein
MAGHGYTLLFSARVQLVRFPVRTGSQHPNVRFLAGFVSFTPDSGPSSVKA